MASPQALTIIGSASSPISNTAGATFAADYAKLNVPNLSTQDRKAIWVYSLMQSYKAALDYTASTTLHKRLMTDAAVYTRGISNLDITTGLAVADWNNADTAVVGTTADVAAILALLSDFRQMPEQALDRIIVFLRIQLGAA